MNPLTNVRNVKKLNEQDLKNGIFDHTKTWHSQYKDSAYIFIGGLPYDLTEGDVLCVFSQYGEIVNINMVRDKKTGKIKGYGFICYEDQRSTILAVDNLNGIKLGGRTIRVDHVSEYRIPKSDEKGEDGKYKDKIETGCAPKTPSPAPSSDEELSDYKLEKKKKKKEKKKNKKLKKRADRDDEQRYNDKSNGEKKRDDLSSPYKKYHKDRLRDYSLDKERSKRDKSRSVSPERQHREGHHKDARKNESSSSYNKYHRDRSRDDSPPISQKKRHASPSPSGKKRHDFRSPSPVRKRRHDSRSLSPSDRRMRDRNSKRSPSPDKRRRSRSPVGRDRGRR